MSENAKSDRLTKRIKMITAGAIKLAALEGHVWKSLSKEARKTFRVRVREGAKLRRANRRAANAQPV